MPESDLDLLISAAQGAGEIALSYWKSDPEVWDKGTEGPVSAADYAVDHHLKDFLLAARPSYGWLSEETEDTADRRAGEALFVCDPIDGTRSFLNGQDIWAHSLAIVRDGTPQAAVIYLPAKKRLFAAALGGGATRDGTPIRAAEYASVPPSVLMNKSMLSHAQWRRKPSDYQRAFRPSLAYRLALVADGSFDGMITLWPTWEWDVAAGVLIAGEAGATVTDRFGKHVSFDTETARIDGLIVGTPDLHRDVHSRLKD